MMTASAHPSRLEWIGCALIGCAGFAILFWPWFLSGFDSIIGSTGDTRIAIAILEHWHRIFTGASTEVLSPGFFYPLKRTLGFTDTLFLFSPPYSVLRGIGFDPFSAFMGSLMSFGVIGFTSFVWLAQRALGATPVSAAIGGVTFAFANMVAVKIIHCQVYGAMLLPLIAALFVSALQSSRRGVAIAMSASAGVLHGLVLLTAFQTGWFFTMSLMLFAACYALLEGWRATTALIASVWQRHRLIVAAYATGFAIGVIPFLTVFGPAIAEGQKFPFDGHTYYAAKLLDIINTTSENLIWGKLLALLRIGSRPDINLHREVELGYGLITFLLWIGLAIALVRQWRRSAASYSHRNTVLLALALMLILGWLVQLRWFGVWPWKWVYAIVPGASAVRVVVRAQIVVNLAASLLIVVAFDTLRQRWTTSPARKLALVALAAFIFAEQIYTDPAVFSRREQARLARVPDPPSACRVFYVLPRTGEDWIHAQNDAMLLSQLKGIPTVNGNTSRFPPGWNMLDPYKDGYANEVRGWVVRHNLETGICGLDPRAGLWRTGLP